MGMGAAARCRGNRGMTTRPAIARLKVTLEDVEPAVMRRLDVPLTIRLDRLHLVLQAAMGWTNSHLYEFRAGGTGWGVPDPDFDDRPLPAAKATLFDVIEDTAARTISLSLRLWRRLGPRRQDRAHRRARPAGSLSAARRRNGPLPARGRGRARGLCRIPRRDRRSDPRGAPAHAHLVRRRLRSQQPRHRAHRRPARPPRAPMGAAAAQAKDHLAPVLNVTRREPFRTAPQPAPRIAEALRR
jgi:hypothetical protein